MPASHTQYENISILSEGTNLYMHVSVSLLIRRPSHGKFIVDADAMLTHSCSNSRGGISCREREHTACTFDYVPNCIEFIYSCDDNDNNRAFHLKTHEIITILRRCFDRIYASIVIAVEKMFTVRFLNVGHETRAE